MLHTNDDKYRCIYVCNLIGRQFTFFASNNTDDVEVSQSTDVLSVKQ